MTFESSVFFINKNLKSINSNGVIFLERNILWISDDPESYDMASSPEGDINTALKQKHFDKTLFQLSRKS